MRVAHQLGRARGAAGVEIGCHIVKAYASAAQQVVARHGSQLFVKAGRCVALCRRPQPHLQHRLQAGHLVANRLHLGPDVGARRRPQRHQHLGAGGAQDLGNLARLQQRIHRVRNAGRLGAKHRVEVLRQQWQHQADDIVRPHAQLVEQVRRLGHAAEEFAMAERQARLVRVGVRQKMNRRAGRVLRRTQTQRFVGAGHRQPLGQRHRLQRPHIGVAGQRGRHGAHHAVDQNGSFHAFS